MKAAISEAGGSIEVADVPDPDTGQEQAIIEPETVGICGTDVKIVKGSIQVNRPLILGHEAVGRVLHAPEGSGLTAGTRVLIDPASACGRCDLCRRRRPHLCRNAGLMGRETDGVFAERVLVPPERLIVVPDHLSDREAGLLQVLGTCIHAQRSVTPFPGDVVAVIGLGVAGQLMAQLLALRGATVVGITRSEWKRELARELGASAVASPEDAGEILRQITEGRGPRLTVEAVGVEATLTQAIEWAGVGGEVLVFGTLTSGGEGLPYYQLYYKELTLYNPRAALIEDYATGVELAASGRLGLEPLVSHHLALDEVSRAFDLAQDNATLKVLMEVG